MKLLVFAFIPPPHHGQSAMVKLMLEGFGGDQRKNPKRSQSNLPIQCYHVDARFATDLNDIGSFRPGKAFRLVRYIAEALWCRFRHGADVLYYVPAMPQKATILRDIVILLIIRRFFRVTIFHWHAAGLGQWMESGVANSLFRYFTRLALRDADLAISPALTNLPDLCKFSPKQFGAVPNGISDPCPEFESVMLPVRRARLQARREAEAKGASAHIKLAYMSLCFEDKGVLDTLDALWRLKEKQGALNSSLIFSLTVAGRFLNPQEESKFWEKVKQLSLEDDVHYLGFVSGEQKHKLLADSDVLCFPTYFAGESFGIVIAEAMAFGLPVVTTRWRSIPEFFPADYPGVVEIKRPDLVAAAILKVVGIDSTLELRKIFLNRFTIEQHLGKLSETFLAVGEQNSVTRRAVLEGSAP